MGLKEIGANQQDSGRSQGRQHGLRMRAGKTVERQRRSRRLQNHRRRQELDEDPERRKRVHRVFHDDHELARSEDALRGHVGFPAQGLDLPLRRRWSHLAERQRVLQIGGRRRYLDGSERKIGARGFPPKPWGRIAVAAAPSNPDVVYALIESTRSALYRSADGGKTWQERDRSQMMVWRPFYFANLIVDPKDENKALQARRRLDCRATMAAPVSAASAAALTAIFTMCGWIRTTPMN